MYDDLSKRQASILAQLRTGMTPLNDYLHIIKAVETNLCDCGEAVESREHFIFHCVRWSEQRKILGVWTSEDNISRLLGGKSTTDTDDWKPDMGAVRAVISFTLATSTTPPNDNERRDGPYAWIGKHHPINHQYRNDPAHPRAHGRPPLHLLKIGR
jgi:hypothetical protein